jgi:FkbM family methyltransferase
MRIIELLDYICLKFSTLAYRISLISECMKLTKKKRVLPNNYKIEIIKNPNRFDDFINFLCFINNNKNLNLIDIGTNVGDFSRDFLLFYPKCKEILCFEPLEFLNNIIKEKINKKKNLKISIINKALSNKKKKQIFYYDKNNTELSSLNQYINSYNISFHNNFNPKEKKIIKLDLLDNFTRKFSRNSDFIVKIDSQGHELEIIQGGLKTISRASILLLECSFAKQYKNKEHTFSRCAQLLSKIDFHPIVFQPRHAGNVLSMHAIERNVIFVKKNLLQKVYYENY